MKVFLHIGYAALVAFIVVATYGAIVSTASKASRLQTVHSGSGR